MTWFGDVRDDQFTALGGRSRERGGSAPGPGLLDGRTRMGVRVGIGGASGNTGALLGAPGTERGVVDREEGLAGATGGELETGVIGRRAGRTARGATGTTGVLDAGGRGWATRDAIEESASRLFKRKEKSRLLS